MAERRMFTSKIVESDDFYDLPFSAQCLYFHMCMNADDDGFLNNAQKIRRAAGISKGDLDLLIEKRFVLSFDNVIVIKGWRMNNQIRKDRYKPTQYTELFRKLKIKDDGSYTENLDNTTLEPLGNQMATKWQPNGNQMATKWQPNGNQMATQVSIGQVSVVQDSLGQDSIFPQETENEAEKLIFGSLGNVLLTLEEYTQLQNQFPSNYKDLIERLSKGIAKYGYKYNSHYLAILDWVKNDKKKSDEPQKQQSSGNPFHDLAKQKGVI